MPGSPRSESLLARHEPFGMRLGLERMRRLLEIFGNPQSKVPPVLVAGTNGKGSTAALLAAVCRAGGYRTGLYTSPHLEAVTERIAVDGHAIADADLAGYLEEHLRAADEHRLEEPPTSFETLTLAAWRHFHAAGVEIAIMEVGLGGRLDATNACEPILSLVTAIARDHERHLGSNRTAIAREKAGILRPARPAIAWAEDGAVRAVLDERAAAIGCRLIFAPEEVRIETPHERQQPSDEEAAAVELTSPRRRYRLEHHFRGRHQLQNLALAVLAAETLHDQGWAGLDARAIEDGVRRARWPGRLERVALPGGRWVILDAAHNPAAVRALADHLRGLPEPPDLLFGAMADKAVDVMLPALAEVTGRIVLTRPRAEAGRRVADPRQMASLLGARATGVAVEPDPAQAFDRALAEGTGQVLVCGSTYLVGEIRGWLRRRFGVPPPHLR